MRNFIILAVSWLIGFLFFYILLLLQYSENDIVRLFGMMFIYTSPVVWIVMSILLMLINNVKKINYFFRNRITVIMVSIIFLTIFVFPIKIIGTYDSYKYFELMSFCLFFSFVISVNLFGLKIDKYEPNNK